ncbi:MAG: hypothetical protein P8N50_02530 [Actinomycetota bacterium]|nr:hypothetical protein [Actinomycetota bacterium]
MHGFVDAQAEGPLFQMDEHGQLIAIHRDNGNASHIPVQPRGVRPFLVADQVPLAQHEGIPRAATVGLAAANPRERSELTPPNTDATYLDGRRCRRSRNDGVPLGLSLPAPIV